MEMQDADLVELRPQAVAVVRDRVPVDRIAAFLGRAFGEVMALLDGQGLAPVGPPFARYGARDGGVFDVEGGFPVSGRVRADGRVVADDLPGGPAAQVLHRGDYAGVAAAYDAASRWLSDHGYRSSGRPWESYLDEPDVPEPRTLVTMPCLPRTAHDGPGPARRPG